MTHVYAYVKEGYSREAIHNLIGGMKSAVCEGLNLCADASTVVVKEVSDDCRSSNFGAFVLVYTAKGKGFDQKKQFAKLLYDAFAQNLNETGNVKMVIKEQAADMVGTDGVLRCHNTDCLSAYEMK